MRYTNYKLRAWMGANRVSGARLAKMICMPYPTFKSKISGKTDWKLSEVVAILKATGCNFEEVF